MIPPNQKDIPAIQLKRGSSWFVNERASKQLRAGPFVSPPPSGRSAQARPYHCSAISGGTHKPTQPPTKPSQTIR